MSINCVLGYFPNKLAHNIMLYFLDSNTFNFYLAVTNGLIWFSHGNKLFLQLIFNDEFYRKFMIIFFRKQTLTVSRQTSVVFG